jgi:hypothetical protein
MERFFRSLKTERLNYQSFANHYEALIGFNISDITYPVSIATRHTKNTVFKNCATSLSLLQHKYRFDVLWHSDGVLAMDNQ